MQKAAPEQIVKVLAAEHPQTIALVLAHLSAAVSKSVLLLLPEPARTQAVKRLGGNAEFFARGGAEDLRDAAAQAGRARGTGPPALTEEWTRWPTCSIASARRSPPTCSRGSRRKTPTLAATIRNQMFTFEDFVEVPETGLRELLAQVDKKILATGAQRRVRESAEITSSSACPLAPSKC